MSSTGGDAPAGEPFSRWGKWGWMVSLLLVTLGAKLWLIQQFGTTLPFFDQWDVEARILYIPWFEGTYRFSDLFAAHNEHRVPLTHLWNLSVLLVSGQWDGQMQMVLNALMHTVGLTAFGWVIAKMMGRPFRWMLWVTIALALVMPFAWENTLAGVQSSFYFLLFSSLVAIWLMLNPPFSKRWWLGAFSAVLSLFSLASGFFCALAVCAVLGLRWLKSFKSPKDIRLLLPYWPTFVFGFIVTMAGFAMKAEVSFHEVLKAHSFYEFAVALGKNLAWPWIVLPILGPANWLPFLVFGWFYFKKSDGKWPLEELTLGIGFWTLLQALATAYARGANGNHPGWRYMDSTSFTMTVNVLSIIILLTRYVEHDRLGKWLRGACWAWCFCCFVGLVALCHRAWTVDIPERHYLYQEHLKNTRSYLATGDFERLKTRPILQIPYPKADRLATVIGNPHIQRILPASVRKPLAVKAEANTGFVTNGVALAQPEAATEFSWGSYTTEGAKAKGEFTSKAVAKSSLPFLEIPVAGNLGDSGVSLELVETASGKKTEIKPRQMPGGKWVPVLVKAPAGEFKIVAKDSSDTEWLAFKEPREVGWLSWVTTKLIPWGTLFFGVGLVMAGWGAVGYKPRK